MSERLGYLAQKEVAKSILNNTYTPDPNLDEYTNTFISFIGAREQLPTASD